MRLGTNTPRWIVVLGALAMAVLSIPGVAAEDTSERSDQAVIDYWATQLASAQAGLDADTTQLEAWAADGETLLVPLGAEIMAIPAGELRTLLAAAFPLFLPNVNSDLHPFERMVRLAQRLGTVLDDEVLTGLAAAAPLDWLREVDSIVFRARDERDELLARRRAELAAEAADLAEFATRLEAYRASVTPDTASVDHDVVTAVEEVGGPLETCLWRTGTFVDHDEFANMRIYAWLTTAKNGAGGPLFVYTAAWPVPDAENPDYILDGQDADLAERLDDGRVVFKGGPGGFCAQVDALCPGARPNPCQVFLGE